MHEFTKHNLRLHNFATGSDSFLKVGKSRFDQNYSMYLHNSWYGMEFRSRGKQSGEQPIKIQVLCCKHNYNKVQGLDDHSPEQNTYCKHKKVTSYNTGKIIL